MTACPRSQSAPKEDSRASVSTSGHSQSLTDQSRSVSASNRNAVKKVAITPVTEMTAISTPGREIDVRLAICQR